MSKPPSTSGAEYQGNTDSSDALIEAANQALFRAMRQGCNREVHFHAGQIKEDS